MITGRKIFITISIVVFLLILSYLAGYLVASRSEGYQVAQQFVHENSVVSDQLGPIKDMRLAYFGYSVRYSGPQGWADFEIIVKGEKANSMVFIKLMKEAGKWEVTTARLKRTDGELIDLH